MNNYLSRIATKTIMKLTPKTSQLETLSMILQLKSVQTSNEAFSLSSYNLQLNRYYLHLLFPMIHVRHNITVLDHPT